MEKASIGRRLATAALCVCLAAMGIPAAALAQDGPAPGADTSSASNPAADASATTARALTADGPAPGEGEAAPVVLASFEEPDPASYEVAAGEDLPALPGSLDARDGDGGQVVVEGVSWECADPDPAAPGTHVFAAVLPKGYEPAPGAQLPQVFVTVAEPQAPAAAPAAAPRGAGNGLLGNGSTENLHVTFNEGTAMQAAIADALANLPEGKDKADVTDIRVAGDAKEITGDDWMALKYCFKTESDWSNLSGLDLSGMAVLKGVSGLDGDNDAFDRLVTLKLPDRLEYVGIYTFFKCGNLVLSEIPANVSLIGDHAFSGCKGLERMSFPDGLIAVDESAFEGCASLKELSFGGNTPPKLGADAFKDVAAGGTVYCPDAKTYEDSFGANGPSGWTYASLYELQVEFNDGAAMQDAIDKALEGKDKGGVKNIVVTGDVTAIAGDDWTALKDCYKDGSAWTSLSGLDLSGMGELGTVSGVDGGGAAFDRLAHVWLPDTMGSIGDYAFSGCTSLRFQYLPDGVTSVGAGAFQGCTSLALGSLVEGVKSIGESAFEGCTSLVLGRLPDSIGFIKESAFSGCEKLDFLEIPANVSVVEPKAFSGCKNLERVSFPSGLKSVGESAFEGCSNLKELSFRSENPPKLDADAFKGVAQLGTVYCPDAKTYEDSFGADGPSGWGYEPFYTLEVVFDDGTAMQGAIDAALAKAGKGKIGAKDIKVTGDATKMTGVHDWGDLERCYQRGSAWANLSGLDLSGMGELTEVSGVEGRVTKDPSYDRLVDLKLPSSLETIGEYAFQNCYNLVLDELPSGLEAVGENAFDCCYSLALDKLPSGLTSIGVDAFKDCSSLALEELPVGVEDVPDRAFQGCISLALAKLPANLSSIGRDAFNGCEKLAVSALPAKVSSIGSSAFSKCEGLKAMALPSALRFVSGLAFQGCTSLQELSFYGEDPPAVLDQDAFRGVLPVGRAFCPEASKQAYEAVLRATGLPDGWTFDALPSYTLEVPFADGGGMQKAIDDALAASKKECYQVTDIEVTGDATAITGDDWTALKGCYATDGDWTALSGLNLSGMGRLKEVSGADAGSATFDGLADLALPDGLKTVGGYTFQGCTNLALKYLPDGLETVGESAFRDCPNIYFGRLPWGLSSIGASAFSGCENLILSEIPAKVSVIEPETFYGCSKGLKSLSLPSGLGSVGEGAFQGCSNLEELAFRGDVPPMLGADAFEGVAATGTVYCPDADTYKGSFGANGPSGWTYEPFYTLEVAFDGGDGSGTAMQAAIDAALAKAGKGKIGAKNIELTGAATKIAGADWSELKNCYLDGGAWANLSGLDLSGMGGLKEVSGTNFVPGTFSELARLALPENLATVGDFAFSGCTCLKEMSFPSGLATVGASAFQDCSNLAALEFHGSAPALGEGAFVGVSASGELYFPQGEDYVQGVFGGGDLKGWGFYDMAQRTLVDATTGAKVSGVLSSNAGLLAQKGGLHPVGTCDACDAMRAREAEGVPLAEFCLSLSSGRLWGGADASIPVGAANDGRQVAVLHCAGGALEEAAATVSGGLAAGSFSSLSPFAVVAPKDSPTPAPKPVPTPGSGLSAIAATGDGLGAAPWLALVLALASAAALALAVRRRSARR